VTFGLNASTITASVAAAGGGATLSAMKVGEWLGEDGLVSSLWPGNGSIAVFPHPVEQNYSFTRWAASISATVSTSSNSSHGGTLSFAVGFYTKNASTLSLASSGSVTYAWTNTSNNSTVSLNGLREITGSFAAMNLTAGNYWIAYWSRTSTVNANWFTASNIIHATSQSGQAHSGYFMAAAVAASFQPGIPGMGTFSATSTNLPVSMAFSNITGSLRWQHRPFLSFANYAINSL